MGVGKREAPGVRQLAAALVSCPNTVSVPVSAAEGFLHRLRQPPIGTGDNSRAMPQSGGQNPNNEPVTLFAPPNMVSVTLFAPRTSTTRHDQVSTLKPLAIRRFLEDGISPNSGSRTSVRPEHQEV
ncbi:MAG: hypothetical protein GX456_12575 [Verrucomicrobia bacterium]|nr:hypothetical protein [Verrucomicrobiota bacterium]